MGSYESIKIDNKSAPVVSVKCKLTAFITKILPFGMGGEGALWIIFSITSETLSEKNGGFPEITWKLVN